MDRTTYQKEIRKGCEVLVVAKVEFWKIPKKKREQIDELTNQYLDSVAKILKGKNI